MTAIIFLKDYHEYREGACVQFSDATSQLLVERGIAKYEAAPVTPEPAPAQKAKK